MFRCSEQSTGTDLPIVHLRCENAMAECLTEISVSAAARLAGCSPDTVLRWIEEGRFAAWQFSPRGWWKIKKESFERYLKRHAKEAYSENTATSAVVSRAVPRF
jgi:excisionase family DNA binding protein